MQLFPTQLLQSALSALLFSLVIIPLIRRVAIKTGWTDKPNHRKLHHQPIPVMGGIAISLSSFMAILLGGDINNILTTTGPILAGGVILLIIGAADDRLDINAGYKLIIQLLCAYTLVRSGICIDYGYGLFGVYHLPDFIQIPLTLVAVTGVVNAFNLMDGIDGLLGGLALMGSVVFGILFYRYGAYTHSLLLLTLAGGMAGFLRYNLSATHKIFLGDAGALFMGFVLTGSGLLLMQTAQKSDLTDPGLVALIVIAVFLLPVLDSLRVYYHRMRQGHSPFRADRSHLHHLLLKAGLRHRHASLTIHFTELFIIAIMLALYPRLSTTQTLLSGMLSFALFIQVIIIICRMLGWQKRLLEWEKETE